LNRTGRNTQTIEVKILVDVLIGIMLV